MTTEKEREANRERQRAFRARKRQEKQDLMDSAESEHRTEKDEADRLNRQKSLGLCIFGECAPGVDASTIVEEIGVAREFARALSIEDVQPGESLTGFCKRVYQALYALGTSKLCADDFVVNGEGSWFSYHSQHRGSPLFSRERQRFDTRMIHHFSGRPFEESWGPPDGSTGNETIDVASLPALPSVPEVADTAPTPQIKTHNLREVFHSIE